MVAVKANAVRGSPDYVLCAGLPTPHLRALRHFYSFPGSRLGTHHPEASASHCAPFRAILQRIRPGPFPSPEGARLLPGTSNPWSLFPSHSFPGSRSGKHYSWHPLCGSMCPRSCCGPTGQPAPAQAIGLGAESNQLPHKPQPGRPGGWALRSTTRLIRLHPPFPASAPRFTWANDRRKNPNSPAGCRHHVWQPSPLPNSPPPSDLLHPL